MILSAPENVFQRLAQRIDPGSRLLRAWPPAGGISATITALELEQPGGAIKRVIVRRPAAQALERDPDAAAREYRLLQLTRSSGLPTQAPLYLDQSGTLFPTPFLVLEYVDGAPQFAFPDLNAAMQQLAWQLAAIHRVDSYALDTSLLLGQATDAAAIFGARPGTLDQSLDEGRIRDILEAAWPFRRPNAPALLHGDYWPGNILWRDGKLAAVIDWEDAGLGDPLVDLSISRLDLAWIFGTEAMDSFTEQYRSRMPIDYTDLAYWDLVAALRLLRLAGADLAAWAAFFAPFGRPDITEATIRRDFGNFTAHAFARLMEQSG